ncbi:MAG: insulinase family protein [Gammaproteobacteria bacterium]|nr:insulinase family protein [Gammaproteobacteria bacterium]
MRYSAFIVSLMLLSPAAHAQLQQEPGNNEAVIQTHQLDNGLKILVLENHRAPVVVSQVWYKVGSSYEYDGITGVSHALEHMMFKGTEDYSAGQFSEIIAANGGSENAFTGKDYTAYFQRIASDRLELCLKLEADRMRNLVLNEDEFKKEIEVIKEERRMRTDDNPTSLTYERFNAVAYLNSSYHQPIIGWMEDLNTMTLDDLSQWYKTWYAPNNATLVVAGDVKASTVFELAEKYFGDFESSKIPVVKSRIEVEQQGERRIKIKAPAKVPYLMMGYKVPVLKTVNEPWEVYALEVLAGILDGGNSSRITRNLVRGKEIASQAGAGYDLYNRQDSLFLLDGTPAAKSSMQQLESALIKEIKKLQKNKPDSDELERVKAQVMSASVYEQDSMFYQAMQLGILETVNLGWQKKSDYLKNIQAVTAEQVQAVAKKYLVEEKLTVAVLEPLPLETKKSNSKAKGVRHVH